MGGIADSFEGSGDHELADKMRFAWADVWDEVAVQMSPDAASGALRLRLFP